MVEENKKEEKEQEEAKNEPKDLSKNQEYQEFLKELKLLASKDGPTSGYEIVQRLISDTFINPYDILMLGPESNEEEIKKQHRRVINITLTLVVMRLGASR